MSAEAAPLFLDTNIFVYIFDAQSSRKATRAKEIVETALNNRQGVISYQVAQEFLNVALQKFARPLRLGDAEEFFRSVLEPMLQVHSSTELFREALNLRGSYSLAWYDSLIVAAASRSGCHTLYSEDMQHGMKIDKLKIVNPFL